GEIVVPNLVVLEKDFEYFIPVAKLAQILKFPSSFDPAHLRIEGLFFNPENSYSIDVPGGTYAVRGDTLPLPRDAVISGEIPEDKDDIYISLELLNKIWPLD